MIFEEIISFKNAPILKDESKKQALEKALEFLHLAAGVSYFKAFIPQKIEIKTIEINKDIADFFDSFYEKGLGEFAFRNNINLRGKIKFPYQDVEFGKANDIKLSDVTAVPIGGGKDSTVTLQSLLDNGENIVPIAVGRPRAIKETIEIANLPEKKITRKKSTELFE